MVVELYRVRCPDCGVKTEKVPQLPSKAPFSKRFEDAVGLACESAAVRRVARQFGLASSTVRAIDVRYLQRWTAGRRKPGLRQMGVDEIYLGKKQKFLTVVSNLQTGEPQWFGWERKKESLDEFFQKQLSAFQRGAIQAACVDMHEPYRVSLEQWAPQCRLVYDKFHVMQHANEAVSEVRRAEFFRKGGAARDLMKGKHWLLLTRWVHRNTNKKRQLNARFALNRRVRKGLSVEGELGSALELHLRRSHAALPAELDRPVALAAAQKPMEKLARMLLNHLEGILNYCRTKVPLGVVEAIHGNIKALLRRGRGYRDLDYLLLKAQRLAATKTEFVAFQKAA